MKTIQELNSSKVPIVIIDPKLAELDKKVLFPEKVAKAKAAFEKCGLPDLHQYGNSNNLSTRAAEE